MFKAKISGLGWLCVEVDNKLVPAFQLTAHQVREFNEINPQVHETLSNRYRLARLTEAQELVYKQERETGASVLLALAIAEVSILGD